MNFKYFLFIFCLLFFSFSFSQEDGNNIKLTALPYYNYGKGVGLTSPDSLFQFNIRFRMQNRISYLKDEDKDAAYEAAIRRLRLRFDGYVGMPEIVYAIQLSFSERDVASGNKEERINIIRDAIVFYRPDKNWNIGFGQTKLPGNRQRINSSGALQLTDRSINNAMFNIDRDFGLHTYYLNEKTNQFSYNIKTAISTGEGRNWTQESDNGLAYTGKVELFPFGAFEGNGSLFEGDITREQKPKLMLSGAYHFNEKARRTRGTVGTLLFDQKNISSLLLDAMFKYQGWSFQAAYLSRMNNDPISVNPDDNTETTYVFKGMGTDAQLSYLFPTNYEVVGRYSYQQPHSDIENLHPTTNQLSLGVSKYIWEHALKLQAEVTNTQLDYLNNNDQSNWYVRFQVEIGI
ncbi:porin [Pseudofulvibacter geojedonensis]|uniref:Porin n=1 Tax=Pseudofulvibacter geojedonensis TaxID=1123758 RepID=A0ABW3HZR7_9FLAO